jgi:hypothetical protein
MNQKKTKGIEMFRLVAGRAIGRGVYASFTPEELEAILREIDIIKPRSHRSIPIYEKNKIKTQSKEKQVD